MTDKSKGRTPFKPNPGSFETDSEGFKAVHDLQLAWAGRTDKLTADFLYLAESLDWVFERMNGLAAVGDQLPHAVRASLAHRYVNEYATLRTLITMAFGSAQLQTVDEVKIDSWLDKAEDYADEYEHVVRQFDSTGKRLNVASTPVKDSPVVDVPASVV